MTDRPRTQSDAFARAKERGRHLAATILSDPDMLTGEAFAHHLGLTASDLRDLKQAHAVLVLPGSSPQEIRYPVWQIDATRQPFPVLPALFDALGDSGWTIYRFLMAGTHWSSGLPTALRKEPSPDRQPVEPHHFTPRTPCGPAT